MKQIGLLLWIIGFVFSAVIALNMYTAYIMLQKTDPLNNPAVEVLIERLKAQPGDQELRQALIELDTGIRSSYFIYQERLSRGRYLLIAGIAVSLTGLGLWLRGRAVLPKPPAGSDPAGNAWQAAGTARIVILLLSIMILAGGILTAVLLPDPPQAESVDDIPDPVELGKDPVLPEEILPDPSITAAQWTAFRGNQGLGLASHCSPVHSFNVENGTNIIWKTPLDKPGFSSPIIWQQKLFISCADKKGREIRCYNTEDGSLLWTHAAEGIEGSPAKMPRVFDETGLAAPTMTTDGLRVYAVFATGDLVASDMDGNRVWAWNLGVPENHYGHSSSLLMDRNRLIVQYDHSAEAFVMVLDGRTGNTIWEAERDSISWSSPALIEHQGVRMLILFSSYTVTAYNPEDGTIIWANDCFGDMAEVGVSPAYADGLLCAVNDQGSLSVIDVSDGHTVWSDDLNYMLPDAVSPVVSGSLLIMPNTGSQIVCIDMRSGELIWEQDTESVSYASPILVNDTIYQFDRQGRLTVYNFKDGYKEIAVSQLGEKVDATPAFVGSRIYVRGYKHLYGIGAR